MRLTAEGANNVGRASLYEIGQIVDYVDLVDFSRERPTEPILSETAKWFCLMTNPNCQGRAALGLYAAGYRTFMPKTRKWVSHARVRKAKEVPLLGRYLFVEVDHPRQSFGAVKAVNGVETLISTLGVPTMFPSHWVDDLRLRYMSGEWDEVAKGPLPVGARIKIVEGEFNEMLATVTKRKGRLIDFKLLDKNQYGRMNECSVRAA